jgi:adenylate cyclase
LVVLLSLAVDAFTQALSLDGGFAPAYAGLAWARLIQESWGDHGPRSYTGEVRDAVARALALDPDLAEAHAALAFAKRYYDWDWKTAENEFRRALELNPNLVMAPREYEFLLLTLARLDEALVHAKRVVDLDPRAALSWVNQGTVLRLSRRYAEAEASQRRALELRPGHGAALRELGLLYIEQQRLADADRVLTQLEHASSPLAIVVLRAYLSLLQGQTDLARRTMAGANLTSFPKELDTVAAVYAALGDQDRAFAVLNRAVADKAIQPLRLLNKELDPLRTDSRFEALLRRMALPPGTISAMVDHANRRARLVSWLK